MKIAIHTWGSEGDVRPFMVLADGLVQAGHDVRLAYSAADGRDYGARLANARYEHRRLTPPLSATELQRIGSEIFAEASPGRQLTRTLEELLDPVIDEMAESARELAKWADLVVLHPMAHPLSSAAEVEHKPCVFVSPLAAYPTRAFPPPRVPNLGPLNALVWKLLQSMVSGKFIRSVNRGRARLGLAPLRRFAQQMERSLIDLVILSPTLLPRPQDWPAKLHLSGFLSPPPEACTTPLSAELETFLAAGSAPIYVTFGSMTALEQDSRVVAEIIDRAIDAVGCRAIVQSEVPGTSSSNVLRVGATPHDRVFPRCSAIVHHGGAGTTQAVLRAGRPSVIVAHITDQFMWGQRLHELGVAPPHLTRRSLDAHRLARAIEQATRNEAMRARAERLGQQMCREDGVRRAVELIEQHRPNQGEVSATAD